VVLSSLAVRIAIASMKHTMQLVESVCEESPDASVL
jgi:hypothetical protein